jgi:hypothetical protein
MTPRRLAAALAIGLLLAFAVACSRGRNDAQIVGEVVTRINNDAQVTNKAIAVSSSNGVVTLNGTTPTDAERAAIANDAAQVEGVRTVVNNLQVAAAAPVPAPAPEPAQVAEAAPPPVERPRAPVRRKPSAHREHRRAAPEADETPVASTPAPAPAPAVTPAVMTTADLPAPAPPPPPKPVTIEAGTPLSVRMVDSIDSGRNHPGDMFHATLDAPITINDNVIIPEGADITGRVVNAKAAGRFEGQPELALELTSLSVNGRKYALATNQYTQQGKSRGARTAKTVGTGAAIGAIIGAIAGGGKGAAIGAATGAGVGGGVEAAGHPEQVHIATEALLSFRLESPLTVTPAPAIQRDRLPSPESRWSPADNNAPTASTTTVYDDSSDSGRPVLKRRPPANQPAPQ